MKALIGAVALAVSVTAAGADRKTDMAIKVRHASWCAAGKIMEIDDDVSDAATITRAAIEECHFDHLSRCCCKTVNPIRALLQRSWRGGTWQ